MEWQPIRPREKDTADTAGHRARYPVARQRHACQRADASRSRGIAPAGPLRTGPTTRSNDSTQVRTYVDGCLQMFEAHSTHCRQQHGRHGS